VANYKASLGEKKPQVATMAQLWHKLYIIFRNAEFFQNYFSEKGKNCVKGNEASFLNIQEYIIFSKWNLHT